MKKILKKLSGIFLTLCLTVSCFSFVAFAAEGTLQFSDPSAAAGDNVTVKVKADTGGGAIGDVDVTLTYDKSILKFVSGTNATGGDGTIQLSSKGDGTSSEANYTLEFTALKEGTAAVEASTYTAYMYDNSSLNLSMGNSTVTIQGGTPVSDTENGKQGGSSGNLQVIVDGKTYTVNENFTEAAVPKGFTIKDAELDGKQTKAMIQETSGQYLFYLEDENGDSDYFFYSTDDGSFSPTAVVDVNSEVAIYLMNYQKAGELPSEYQETTTDIDGKVFSAWQNMSEQEYYLVYALSSDGNKGYYQYDTTEGTYQRYVAPAAVEQPKSSNSMLDKAMNFLENHLIVVMCALWAVFLILLIIIIILGVKLSHRNQELDDLYDEYGIGDDDDDSDDDLPRAKKKTRRQPDDFEEEEYGEDEFEDYEDNDEYEEDEEFDEYEDEEFDEYEDEEFDEYEDDDEDFEEYDEDDDEEYEPQPAHKSKKKKDDYSMDFIDI
ncbi:MAG: cohesin domain-containing protein [Muricomes sp.]